VNIKKSILLLLFLLICFLIFILPFRNNLGIGVKIVNDSHDRHKYAVRGSWFSLSKIPYTEVFSEYPQVATYFFALPYVLLETIISRDKILIDLSQISNVSHLPYPPRNIFLSNEIVHYYAVVFSFLMMVSSFLSISLLYELRKNHKNLSLLLLLPASLYFTYNRYDIMPCFLSLLSLYLLSKKQYKMSAFVLSIGMLTKWYLLLLLPIFLTYYYSTHNKINWSMIIIFSLTSFMIILPTLISSGIDGLLVPYKFHFSRGVNNESLFYLINYLSNKTLNTNITNKFTFPLFFLLQLSIVPLCITSKILSFEKVIKWSALSILIFMLFAKYYSPQWILWISPLLILDAIKRVDAIWIVLFDLITYIYFPISYTVFGINSIVFYIIIVLKTILIVKFTIPLFCELIGDNTIFAFAQKHLIRQIKLRFSNE